MKKSFLMTCLMLLVLGWTAANAATSWCLTSPGGQLQLSVELSEGQLLYSLCCEGKQLLAPSRLGLKTSLGDFTASLSVVGSDSSSIDETYALRGAKCSQVHYVARQLLLDCENAGRRPMGLQFRLSDTDLAFRYLFPQCDGAACMIINQELTSFRLPEQTTTFICPQSEAMAGWERTKPSYEEEYLPDAPLTQPSAFGQGYTFPCLFRVGEDGWVLISETGTNGSYAACHLSDYDPQCGYRIAFPMPGEANGWGSSEVTMALPGRTPWRTLTLGPSLKPIVETTVAYDVVEPQYQASCAYPGGRYTWSWLIWQDRSINYDDQVQFINTAAAMGYEYCLVDAWWDTQIGRERMAELSRYALSQGVGLMLWYNSNGAQNNAPQGPKNCMSTSVQRKREMAWLQSIGVKGIKVDFLGSDKQHTMQLYEDILSDANDYGLQVIFHGCTLPRGWERMYPNFVSSEAVLASENVYFTDYHAQREAFELCMHPFCRNTLASMDWGGTIMNKYLSRDNKSRHRRYTSDVFEMAAAIVCQSRIQCIAIQPNNLTELPQTTLDFLKRVPAEWDETRFIDGYPGRYVVLARRHGDDWYVVGLNAGDQELKLKLSLPMFGKQPLSLYTDKAVKDSLWPETLLKTVQPDKQGRVRVSILSNGGFIILPAK